MITYKYKLYNTKNSKHLEKMLREAAFVWNHALAMQKRYYSLHKKFIHKNTLQKHFAKRIKRNLLHSQTVQEIIERLDNSYKRFFKKLAVRPPKFKRASEFTSFVYKQGGFTFNGNTITLNSIKKRFRFSKSREIEGTVKTVAIKRTPLGEFYVVVVTDKTADKYRKSRNGASVGIDFGLKTYLTLSDGKKITNPQYLKRELTSLRKASKSHSKAVRGSKNKERKRINLCRQHKKVVNLRNDFQWKLAHELCSNYDCIFLEDLTLTGMTRLWGRKVNDLSHGSFVEKLYYVASKYDVTIHKIDKWFASSKTCPCGFVYKELSLHERSWVCPECGETHDRDLLASNNILRKGISELRSKC